MKNSAFIAIGSFLFYHRNWVFPLLILAVFLVIPAGPAGGPLDWLGAVAILAGLAIRFVVIAVTPVKRDGASKRVNAPVLKTAGLFSTCRNPLYVGNMLIASGYFLLHGAIAAIVIGVGLSWLIYQAIIANEENFLSEKFGQAYSDYQATTNRWMPRPDRLRGAFQGLTFNFVKAVRAEWNVILSASVISAAALWYTSGQAFPPVCARLVLAAGLAVALIALIWNRRSAKAAKS